ncbi:MAG: gliding motility-associated C-terminal domain-containing protein [Chitinophagaceae bacterium]|nr:gliding motility-associated C-terminal domain-containing protein [Chitinophagaceae bacterium]
MIKRVLPVLLLLFVARMLQAQPCPTTGQTPSSAILLCGSDSYVQTSITPCGQTSLPVPCNGSYVNQNPTWFKMSCFSPGTLGFVIVPENPDDNFDWQLFDISGRNNDDVFTDASLFLACNWSPETGETGASMNGIDLAVCPGSGQELFSKMPTLIQGHEYLLMVSQRTGSTAGFQISITGGTASVTDPVEPDLFNARLNCDGTQLLVLLNKRMICGTIATDGSDFTINAPASITSAQPSGCNLDGESSLIVLSLSNPVVPGNYVLGMQLGSDGNTIKDKCGRMIDITRQTNVILPGVEPALPDSIKAGACSPRSLVIIFRKPVQCNSIAPNGSDFIITGPQSVQVTSVAVNCANGNPNNPTTTAIEILTSSPITVGGNYNVVLTTGTDGNALVDECGQVLPAGSTIPFISRPSVSADFTYSVKTSCRQDTVYLFHDGNNGAISWNWNVGSLALANSPSAVQVFNAAEGEYKVRLVVSNGTCSDTATEDIVIGNVVKAAFTIPDIICPEDTVHVANESTGMIDKWRWDFGNGSSSQMESPAAIRFPITGREAFYTVRLTVTNSGANCSDSIAKRIQVLSGCFIAVPTAFTPNNDGKNDFLHPLNAVKAEHLVFKVYNRFGQLVFETRDWTRKWDGRIGGIAQATGVYAWMLTFTNRDTKERVFMKGTTLLIR